MSDKEEQLRQAQARQQKLSAEQTRAQEALQAAWPPPLGLGRFPPLSPALEPMRVFPAPLPASPGPLPAPAPQTQAKLSHSLVPPMITSDLHSLLMSCFVCLPLKALDRR